MAISIKLTKFDNTPWGFRLAGGSDFPQPLTVIRVAEGSLAECMGLKVGDVVVRLNDQPISNLTHGQAHEALLLAGNNFTLGVHREEDPLKAVEAISEDNIVPYKIPLDQLPPVYPETILLEESVTETCVEEVVKCTEPEVVDVKPEGEEEVLQKPKDADSEVVPNRNLTDDEIAQLILEEEELLIPEQGVLGVNFKKLRPRLPNLKESKVVEELQSIATEDPPRLKERKHVSTFLQKPQRPIPQPRAAPKEPEEPATESYKVVIKKQERKSVTKRLLEKGLLHPGPVPTPEYRSEVNMFVPSYDKTASEIDRKMVVVDVPETHDKPIVNGAITMNGVLPSLDEYPPVFAVHDEPMSFEELIPFGQGSVNPENSEKLPIMKMKLKRWPNRRCFRAQYFKKSLYWLQTTLLNILSFLFGFNVKNNALKKKCNFKGRYVPRIVSSCWDFCRKFCFTESYLPKKKLYLKGRYCNKCFHECRDLCLSIFKLPLESAVGYASAKLSRRKFCRRGHYLKRNLCWYRDSGLRLLRILYPSDRQSSRRSSIRMKGHYFETCLRRDSVTPLWNLRNLMDEEEASKQLFNSLISNAGSRRSSCSKAHYAERIIVKNVKNIGSCFQSEFYNPPIETYSPRKYSTSRRNSYVRAHYAERVVAGYLENFGLFMGNLILAIFARPNEPDSRVDRRESSSSYDLEMSCDSIRDTLRSEIFHRGNRKFSRLYKAAKTLEERRGSLPIRREGSDFEYVNVYKIKEPLELTGDYSEPAIKITAPHEYKEESDDVETDVKSDEYLYNDEEEVNEDEEDREMSLVSETEADEENGQVSVIQDDVATSKIADDKNILQPEEVTEHDNISAIDFDDLIDAPENNDENEDSKPATINSEDLICPRKTLIFADEKDMELKENGSVSFNDVEPIAHNDTKNPNNTVSWNSLNHSEKPKEKPTAGFISSTKDYISLEVFHRGARRRSSRSGSISSESLKPLAVAPGKYSETNGKNFIGSTKDYIALEVFHRGARRRSSRSGSITCESLKFLAVAPGKYSETNGTAYEKLAYCKDVDSFDRENRRLSFVPTILYEGITSRIGIDFTKLFVYGFVPCTSLVLLYAYKSHFSDLSKDTAVH